MKQNNSLYKYPKAECSLQDKKLGYLNVHDNNYIQCKASGFSTHFYWTFAKVARRHYRCIKL